MKPEFNILNKRCFSTLAPLRDGVFYSSAARKKLWNGKNISPFLDFDRPDFAQFRREHSSRFSISGIQDKISLRLEKNRLVPTAEEGEFILKPIPNLDGIPFLADIPANEHVTMQMASQLFRLPTAANGVLFFSDKTPAYVTRRFDWKSLCEEKFHQEDFCQLSERSEERGGSHYKYDSSYEEVGELLYRFCPAAAVEVLKLFRLILFNYLIGNGDAHLKNFSLLENSDGDMLLSPAYDLLNTTLHFPNESRTALDFFKTFETPSFSSNGFYAVADFLELANRLGLPKKQTQQSILEFGNSYAAVDLFIKHSLLSEKAQKNYLDIVADRIKAINLNT